MGKFRKLGRHAAHRVSMLRTMVSQLVKHERIETTVAKAKEVRRKADQMVQLGKDGTLDAARRASAFVRGDDVVHKLFTELAYRYKYAILAKPWIKIEPVDTQDCCELGYELVMLHRWHTLSLSTERMNFERPNLQRHLHLSVFHLIRGPSLVLASSGQDRKLAGAQKQKAYEINYLYHVSFW